MLSLYLDSVLARFLQIPSHNNINTITKLFKLPTIINNNIIQRAFVYFKYPCAELFNFIISYCNSLSVIVLNSCT